MLAWLAFRAVGAVTGLRQLIHRCTHLPLTIFTPVAYIGVVLVLAGTNNLLVAAHFVGGFDRVATASPACTDGMVDMVPSKPAPRCAQPTKGCVSCSNG